MNIEHDGCVGCKFIYLMSDEYPCNKCKGTVTFTSDSDEYSKRKDMWKQEDDDSVKDDVVNHPSHYTQGNIECIEAMESAFGAEELAIYCKIAAFKYIWRTEHKNGLEDIKKALWYMNKYVELSELL